LLLLPLLPFTTSQALELGKEKEIFTVSGKIGVGIKYVCTWLAAFVCWIVVMTFFQFAPRLVRWFATRSASARAKL
jgi:hypothetical protein